MHCLCCSLEQGPRPMYSDGGFFTITLSLRISRRVNPWILLWRNQSPVFSILNPIFSISRNIQKDDPRFLTPSPLFVQIVTTLYYVILLKHSISLLGQRRVQINERFLFLEGSVWEFEYLSSWSSYSALRCEHSPGQRPAPHKLSLVQTIMSRRKLRQS